MSQKSILAKLLATENIRVQHGNYETAWFDIKNRVLGLPQWADRGKDVNDLLIGHEVGHALETPFEGWHDSPEKLEGCPRSYINVVEDARIERKIKSRYVGLIGPFQRGYAQLFADGFFGDEHDFDNMKLIDKINLKAKVGAHLDITFNDEEMELYNRTMKTDTFEDVVEVVKAILAYTKENTPELLEPPQMPEGMDDESFDDGENHDGPAPSGHDDYEQPQTSFESKSEDSEDSDDRKETTDSSSRSDDENTLSPEEDSPTPPSHKEDDVASTDENFRKMERDLLDFSDENKNKARALATEFSKDTLSKIIVDYKQLDKSRKRNIEKYRELKYEDEKDYEDYREGFKEYYKKVQRDVGFAVKEFELKKAAYRWTRAQTARTGSINVNKLWAYKTDDDIFSRVTRLADSKNHGMIGLIDYSGSMNLVMGDVLDQVVHLAVFCRKINIPFDIYGFTTENYKVNFKQLDGELDNQTLSMPQIISSTLKKADFEEAVFHCYVRKEKSSDWSNGERYIMAAEEGYGSTPLNEALVATTQILKSFQRKHNVDKMNLVVISDGDANGSRPHMDTSLDIKRIPTQYYSGMSIKLDGRLVKGDSSRRGLTTALLQNLSKNYGVNTLGFFISDGHYGWRNKLQDLYESESGDWGFHTDEGHEWKKEANKEYRRNKCIIKKDVHGYDTYYLLKGGPGTLKTEGTEFAPEAGATKGQLTSSFKNAAKSGKTNKVLLKNFGGAVA